MDVVSPIKWRNYKFIYSRAANILTCHGAYVDRAWRKNASDRCIIRTHYLPGLTAGDTVGTLVEIGAAHAYEKLIFIAFANKGLRDHFYFVDRLACYLSDVSVDVIVPTAKEAWQRFLATLPAVPA